MTIETTNVERKIANTNLTNLSSEEINVLKATVAKGTTDTELAYFLAVCKTVGLKPFNKEIWCYKDNRDNLIVFTGRDGFLAKAQENPVFNGIRSCEICEKDEYELDIPNGIIHHKIKEIGKARGKILGGYCIVFRLNGESTIEFVEFDTYNKGFNTWKTHPADMIKKVAESKALKKAFGISMVQSEEDFDIKNNVAIPIDTTVAESDLDIKRRELIEALDIYQGEDKEEIRKMCADKITAGEFTIEFAENTLKRLMNE